MGYQINDIVEVIKSNCVGNSRGKDIGCMGRIDSIEYDRYLIDFGEEFPFTHNGTKYFQNHYRWYHAHEIRHQNDDVIDEIKSDEIDDLIYFKLSEIRLEYFREDQSKRER